MLYEVAYYSDFIYINVYSSNMKSAMSKCTLQVSQGKVIKSSSNLYSKNVFYRANFIVPVSYFRSRYKKPSLKK